LGSGKTNHIERFNNTMRQRISRLVRKTLSFSKKLVQVGANNMTIKSSENLIDYKA
jgi:IS1 family transposase